MFWYIITGIREGLTWKRLNKKFLKLTHPTWVLINNWFGWIFSIFSIIILCNNQFVLLIPFLFCIWLFAINGRDRLDIDRTIHDFYKIDYHTLRGLEGLGMFGVFWILLDNFFLVSACWIIGNWIYKRMMNKVLYNTFKHHLTMTKYRMFGKDFPYSDRWYDYSLILPIIYFII